MHSPIKPSYLGLSYSTLLSKISYHTYLFPPHFPCTLPSFPVSNDPLTLSPKCEEVMDNLHELVHTKQQQSENKQRLNAAKDAKQAVQDNL